MEVAFDVYSHLCGDLLTEINITFPPKQDSNLCAEKGTWSTHMWEASNMGQSSRSMNNLFSYK